MPIRHSVVRFLANGQLPDEDQSVDAIGRAQSLLEAIQAPVTAEEAHALCAGFGSDDCYGLSWTLVHLIETAPGARTVEYAADSANPWIQLLRARVDLARKLDS